GQTKLIMADTFKKVEAVTQKKGPKRTRGIVLTIVTLSLIGFAALGFVIWQQKKQIEQILHRKDSLDKQIAKIQLSMQIESDPEKRASLEEQLTALTGKAQAAIGQMQQKDRTDAPRDEPSCNERAAELRSI